MDESLIEEGQSLPERRGEEVIWDRLPRPLQLLNDRLALVPYLQVVAEELD